MVSIVFSGKVVMAMHIVTIEIVSDVEDSEKGKYLISLSNGLVLEEMFTTEQQKIDIAQRLAFIDK